MLLPVSVMVIFVCICSSTEDFLHFPSNHQYSPISFTNTFHPVIPRSLTAFVRIGLPLGCSQNCAAANIGGFTAMPLLSFGTLNLHSSLSFDPQPFRRILSIKLTQIMSNLCVLDSEARGCFSMGWDVAWYHYSILALVMHHVRWLNPGG